MFTSVIVLVDDPSAWPACCSRLRAQGLYPEGLAVRSLDASAHREAWVRAMVREGPTLVLGVDMALRPGWQAALESAAGELDDQRAHVVHLDGDRRGDAYVLTVEGADLLVEAAPELASTAVDAMAEVPGLSVVALEPVLAEPAGPHHPSLAAVDDLERLLRYEDAIALGDGLLEVGDELLSLAFWTPAFCRAVVRAAEALDAWGSDEIDPVPGTEVSLSLISPRLYAHVEDHVAASVVPQLRLAWPTLEFHGLRDVFVIRYEAGDADGLRLHHDVAQVSASVRLNDGYEGGELVFPRQGVSNRMIPVGHLLAWPSLVTHPHAAEPVVTGVKYGLTIWFEVPGDAAI